METEPGDPAERLREALEQQRATSEILAAISRAPFDLDNTLRTILEQGTSLCRADTGRVLQVDGSVLRERVQPTGTYQWVVTPWQPQTVDITRRTLIGKAVLEARTQHAPDVRLDPEVFFKGPPLTRLAVPITVAGRVVGVLNFHRVAVAPFSPSEIALIETFADQAAIAIENVRLFNETREALERQTATGEVLKAISTSTTDVQPVFDAVVERAARLCDADMSTVNLRVDADHYRLAAAWNLPDWSVHRHELTPLERGTASGRVYLEGRTMHWDDFLDDPELSEGARSRSVRQSVRSLLCVPITKDGQTIGTILLRRSTVRPFAPHQIELVETFADQAAIAIDNVRLFNETRDALERQMASGTVLGAIADTRDDITPVLQTIVDEARRLCAADAAFFYRLDGEAFILDAIAGSPAALAAGMPATTFTVGASIPHEAAGLLRLAFDERRTFHVPDMASEDARVLIGSPRSSDDWAAFYGASQRARLAVPVLYEGAVIGVIRVHRTEPGGFNAQQIILVETFAAQAAIAIRNVRLFNEIQDKSRQLEVASRNKSEFLANMSHELRTPLNAVIGFSDVLEQRMFGELTEHQAEYVRDIAGSGRQLLSLVNEILDLSKVEAGRMELELGEFDLGDTIRVALTFVRERASSHAITLSADSTPDLGTVVADERKIRQVLLNLLSNAVKFTPDGGSVGVYAERIGSEAHVSVRDSGIGIAAEDLPRVFEEFRQVGTPSDRSREGTGLGLALAKRFIELHGGRMWIDSQLGIGTTFTFAIPVGGAAPAGA